MKGGEKIDNPLVIKFHTVVKTGHFEVLLEIEAANYDRVKKLLEQFKKDEEVYHTWHEWKKLLKANKIESREIVPIYHLDF